MSIHLLNLGIRAYSGVGFQPSDISGLVGWWDASDTDTLTLREDSGTYYVTQWDDKSATGTYALMGNTAYQPIYIDNSIYFDSAGKLLSMLDSSMTRNKPYVYLFSVFKYLTTSGYKQFLRFTTASGGLRAFLGTADTNTGFFGSRRLDSDSAVTTTAGTLVNGTKYLFLNQLKYNDAIMIGSVNDTSSTVDPFQTAGNTSDTDSFSGRSGFGDSGAVNTATLGYMYESLIYTPSSALTSGEIAQIKNYLNAKWSVY